MNSTFKLRQRGREDWEPERRRPRRGRPCAAAGPWTPPPCPARDHAALRGPRMRAPLLIQKHKSAVPPSLRGLILRPPRPPPSLKGQRRANFPLLVQGGTWGPCALEEAQTPGQRRGEPRPRGEDSLWGHRGKPQPRPPRSPCSHLPFLSLSPPDFLAFKEGVKKRKTMCYRILFLNIKSRL